jgi:acetyl esterase/lipase
MPNMRLLPSFVFASILCLCGASLPAQLPGEDTGIDANLGMSTIPLWPHGAPGAKGTAPTDVPTLTVFRPSRANGTAIIVAPGGAYIHLAANHEGREPADRLSELGITTFVLRYRLGPTYRYPVPLEDARRAVRLVRSLAPKYGFSPDRIGMMGFSAGGHLTAITGVLPEDGKPGDPDPVERESSRLNFLVLGYPWLNAMQPPVPNPYQPGKNYINLCSVTEGLTQADCTRLDPQYTPEAHVTAATPPTFIVHTADDATVPVSTSVGFFTAMHKAGADCELHIFGHGPHGFGPGGDNPELASWQETLTLWLRAHGLLNPVGTARAR